MEHNNTKSVNFNMFSSIAKAICDNAKSTVEPLAKVICDNAKSTVEPLVKTVSENAKSTAILISDSVDIINTIGKDVSEKLYLVVKPVVKTFNDINSSFKATMGKLLEISGVLKGNSDLKVSLQFEEQKVSSGDSRYTKCIFGYYRSKYLRRSFYPDFGVTDFDLSVDTNFFAVYGGGI